MEFPLELAIRYMRSKKRAFVSVGTLFAIIGVTIGVAALTTVMSVTGGFREEFREKVLGVNAHVLVLKYSSDFSEYRSVMEEMRTIPGVTGVAPFVINPMMVTHGEHTATGVLLKGVDPDLMASVLDLPKHVVEPAECNQSLGGDPSLCISKLRLPDAQPPERRRESPLELRRRSTGSHPLGEDADDDEDVPEKPILEVLKESVERSKAAVDEGTPGEEDSASAAGATTEDAADHPVTGAAVGSTVPEGGWGSKFLDDDDEIVELGDDVDPDPCSDAGRDRPLSGIIVGASLKEKLEIEIGDCVQVTSPTIGFTYTRGAIRAPVARQFRVVAVFDAGFDQYDSKLVYTDLYESQAFYDNGDSVTGVEMKVADIDRARQIKAAVDERLKNGLYNTMDWEELNHGLFTALRIQQIVMSLVLALIIVVAAFTVIATLIMVVLDKKKEIAVLKAMGATNFGLLRTFLYQGGIIGVFGTAAGLLLGWVMCEGLLVWGFPLDPKVYFIERLPVQTQPLQFVIVGVFSMVVCLVATVWPAMYAARLRPADAFREQ
jgi:lipoprotein-releasing system permease protein